MSRFYAGLSLSHHHCESSSCKVCIAAHSASPKTTSTLPRVMFDHFSGAFGPGSFCRARLP